MKTAQLSRAVCLSDTAAGYFETKQLPPAAL